MRKPFDPDKPLGQALFRWWSALDDNRADRAELRRCGNLLEVMLTPAFQRARRALTDAGLDARGNPDRLAAVVALAAAVRGPRDIAAHRALPRLPVAFSEGESRPPVSPLRFRQVLESRDDEELFARLRRLLPLVENRVSIFELGNDVLQWNDKVRTQWVYEYRWPDKESD